jgi:hypothetical protein
MDTKIGTMEMLLLQRRIRQHTFGYLSPKNLQKLNGMDAKVSRGGRQMKCDICGAELYEERKVCVPCYQKYYKEIIAYEKWQYKQENLKRKGKALIFIKTHGLQTKRDIPMGTKGAPLQRE